MAKQQAQQPRDGIGAVAVASLMDVDAADDVESLARDLFVAVAPTHSGGYTPGSLAEKCFTLAEAFHAVRDKRRAKKQAG